MGRPLRPQPDHRRRRDRPLRDRPAAGALPAHELRVHARAAGERLPSPYAAFLFDTETGYCQHFAGAMALLLRFNGIPARVAVGFTSGERGVHRASTRCPPTTPTPGWRPTSPPSAGWRSTPPRAGACPSPAPRPPAPGFIDPSPATRPAPRPPTTAPRPVPRPAPTEPGPGAAAERPSWMSTVPWLPWVLGLVVMWPPGRSAGGSGGSGACGAATSTERFAASLRLLRGDLAAYGVAATGSSTFEEVLDIVEDHLGLEPRPGAGRPRRRRAVRRRQARTEDVERAEAFRREVERRLRRRHGWVRTLLAWYGAAREAARRARGGGTAAPARAARSAH